jgi:hypothetical protein
MAQSQYGFGSPVVFHDVTAGNNSVPGVTGYSAETGYDQVTGLGSVDANALVNDWGGPSISAFSVSPGSLVLGKPFTISATVSNIGGSSLSEIQVWRAANSGGSPGTWAQVNSTPLSGDGPSSISLNDTPSSTGSYWYGAHACNQAGTCVVEPHTVEVTVTAPPPGFTVSTNTSSQTVTQGQSAGFTLTMQSVSGFHAVVTPAALKLPTGYLASGTGWNPLTVTPAANGSASSTLTVATSASTTPGTYIVTLQASATGYTTQTVTVTIIVNAVPVISVTPSTTVVFPNTPGGSSSTENFTVQNTGYGTLSGTVSVAAPFSIASGGSYSLGAGASQTVMVRFTPSGGGSYSQSVSFTGAAGAMRTVTGTGMPVAPTVTTGAASSVTSNSATLGGTVNPNGAATQFWFLYATNSSLSGATKTGVQSLGSGTSASAISANIAGLAAGTTYYYQLQASNSAGTSSGGIQSLTTLAATPTISSVVPNPVTGSNSPQPFTINGTGFMASSTVTLGNAYNTYPNRPISSRSAGQLVINPTFGTTAATWWVEVINGSLVSNRYSFSVR